MEFVPERLFEYVACERAAWILLSTHVSMFVLVYIILKSVY